MASSAQILDSIPNLTAAQDVAALVALQDHADRNVRKSVRKALHGLRSKGLAIPAAGGARVWVATNPETLRGELREVALIDTSSTPGCTRILISAPQAEERGYLWVATISGRDRILDFAAYVQTDGQRTRMLRDWRGNSTREVPPAWARARIRWAREQTLSAGFSVPTQLDDMLIHLGPAPSERPANFLGDAIPTTDTIDTELARTTFGEIRVFAWPPLFDLEQVLERLRALPALEQASDSDSEKPAPDPEAQRARIRSVFLGDQSLREALSAQFANLLDDAAIAAWITEQDDRASVLRSVAQALRAHAEPETLPWVDDLVMAQLFSWQMYTQQRQADADAAV